MNKFEVGAKVVLTVKETDVYEDSWEDLYEPMTSLVKTLLCEQERNGGYLIVKRFSIFSDGSYHYAFDDGQFYFEEDWLRAYVESKKDEHEERLYKAYKKGLYLL